MIFKGFSIKQITEVLFGSWESDFNCFENMSHEFRLKDIAERRNYFLIE